MTLAQRIEPKLIKKKLLIAINYIQIAIQVLGFLFAATFFFTQQNV